MTGTGLLVLAGIALAVAAALWCVTRRSAIDARQNRARGLCACGETLPPGRAECDDCCIARQSW